ncbi:MAG: hydrogenase maturation nickel metallochaperone HypA [Acidobacteria bacterium]|nr:hydrogenase maturation nickel metallochaperone HypA [Acidobacteriota bacterium]
MHELSIALSLVEMAIEEAERRGSRVIAAHVRLGVLSGVVKEALMSAYEMASEGTSLEGSALIIDEISALIHCAVCEQDRPTRRDERFACEVCGTPATEFLRGRELELAALELAAPELPTLENR